MKTDKTEISKLEAIQVWLERCKNIFDNQEDVVKFFNFVNKEIDDIRFPKSHRDYKFNFQTGKYDITEVEINPPRSAFFSELENDTYSRQEWYDSIIDFAPVHGHKDNFFDEDIISAAYAFMIGPVGIQRKKAIAAESRTYASLEELKKSILTEAKEKDMILYITFTFEKPDPRDVSLSAFTVTENYPKIIMYCWRGVFLDKE